MSDLDIKKIRQKLGVSQRKLAEMIGVSEKTVQNWEYGKTIPVSKHQILRSLLLSREDYIEASDDQHKVGKLIPFYDNVSTIGGINELSASIDAVSQPTEYINSGDWFRGATAAIRHYGDSMVEYPSGCILAIKEVYDRELIIPGRDYVIETSEYRVTKRIQRGKDLSHITAYSTNPETYADGRLIHEPFDIAWQSIIRVFSVLGYVVKKMEK